MNVFDVLDVTQLDRKPTHSVWLREQRNSLFGHKIPFQFGGEVQKYQRPLETAYPLDTLCEEAALIDFLASKQLGPPRYDWVYYKTIVSDHLGDGARWADPCGAYGFEMADANVMPPGKYDVDALKSWDMVRATTGAWSDAMKPHNIVNGYLVDTRRSWFDRLQYLGSFDYSARPLYVEDRSALHADLRKEGSFPFKEREQPYQEYYLDGVWHQAEREVHKRAVTLGMTIAPGESMLDLGSCLGGFTTWAMLHGASRCVGLDSQAEFVSLAQRLARANAQNIAYVQFDLTCVERDSITCLAQHLDWLKAIFPLGIDHLVCLSMGKHLSESIMWWWIDHLKAKHTYLETNAVKPEMVNAKQYPYWNGVQERGGTWLGMSHDRNERALYRIDRG